MINSDAIQNPAIRALMERVRRGEKLDDEDFVAAGLPPLSPPPPACEQCDNNGWYLIDAPGHPMHRKSMPCDQCAAGTEQLLTQYRRNFEQSGLAARYQDLTFETFEQLPPKLIRGKELAFHVCRAYAHALAANGLMSPVEINPVIEEFGLSTPKLRHDVPRNSIVLYGPFGTGKTGLAASIFNALVMQYAVLYIRTQALIDRVQQTYKHESEETRSDVIFQLQRAPVLILDEMTLENYTNDRLEIIENVMRHRCAELKPFVATTNLAPDEFAKAWGGRITEVMLETAHWLPMTGTTLRMKSQPFMSES